MHSSNGFLQTLDLQTSSFPALPFFRGFHAHRRVIRSVLQSAGDWVLFTADGRRHDARLTGGWVLPGIGWCGLVWRTESGRRLTALIWLDRHTAPTRRRLLVRLRWPQT